MVNDANNDLHDIFVNIDGNDVCLRARARNLKTKNRDEMLSIIAEWQACDRAHTNHHTTKDTTWSYPKFATHLVTDSSGNQFPAVKHNKIGWLIFTPTFCKIIPMGYLIGEDYTEYQSEMILAH